MATFTWLDFSEQERQRALDVLELFREHGTVDELGIGTVRDAMADVLFPGTSTIMTRARYYFFVPWLYQALERKKTTSSEIVQKAKKAELGLIEALYEAGERDGLIGVEARKTLKRLPSTIYWQGLGVLGIRRFPGSRDRYHRALDRIYREGGDVLLSDDERTYSGGRRSGWHAGLPSAPADFPQVATFALTEEEAAYFRERVQNTAPGSYFAWLVSHIEDFEDKDLPWDTPLNEGLPDSTASDLLHARNFSDCMLGAALIYNLMLSEKGKFEVKEAEYRDMLAVWVAELTVRMAALKEWRRDDFWEVIDGPGVHVTPRTREFINWWLGRLLSSDPASLAQDASVRKVILLREKQLKGQLARLGNARALENWGGASSAGRLDYRWNRPTRRLMNDLKLALVGE